MIDTQILEKAIEKAIKNGYTGNFVGCPEAGAACGAHGPESDALCEFSTIFSHNFAKAFWGGALDECKQHQFEYSFYVWEHHLQQMVLEPEPLKYLERFL